MHKMCSIPSLKSNTIRVRCEAILPQVKNKSASDLNGLFPEVKEWRDLFFEKKSGTWEGRAFAAHSLAAPTSYIEELTKTVSDYITQNPPHDIHWSGPTAFNFDRNMFSRTVAATLWGADVNDIRINNEGLTDRISKILQACLKQVDQNHKIAMLDGEFVADQLVACSVLRQKRIGQIEAVLSESSVLQERKEELNKELCSLNSEGWLQFVKDNYVVFLPKPEDSVRKWPEQAKAILDKNSGKIAGFLVPSVYFKTNYNLPLEVITTYKTNFQTTFLIVDDAHGFGTSVGLVENNPSIDAVVSCGYKHIVGTPGMPGMTYIAPSFGQKLVPTLSWKAIGTESTPYVAFDAGLDHSNETNISKTPIDWFTGSNPNVFGMIPLVAAMIALGSFGKKELDVNTALFCTRQSDFPKEISDQILENIINFTSFYQLQTEYLQAQLAHQLEAYIQTQRISFSVEDSTQRGNTVSLNLSKYLEQFSEAHRKETFDTIQNTLQKTGVKIKEENMKFEIDGRIPFLRMSAHPAMVSFQDIDHLATAIRSCLDASKPS